jgi:hypothetical protein
MTTPSISDRIAALATKMAADRESLDSLIKSLDDKPGDTTIAVQVEQIGKTMDVDNVTMETLQRAEKAMMIRAVPITPHILTPTTREKMTPDHIWRAGVVMADAFYTRRPIEQVVKERYPDSQLTADLCVLALNREHPQGGVQLLRQAIIERAAQGPATSFTAGYAAELVHQTYAAFMQALVGVSAVAKVEWRSDSFENGAPIIVPYRKQRAAFPNDLEAAFRKERVGRLETGAKSVPPYNWGVIGTFTRELMRRATPAIEGLIRQAMLDDTAEIIDGVVFGAGALVADVRPAGLTNGIAVGDTAVATATPTPADINNDLNARVKQLLTVRRLGGPNTFWVMNTATKITLADLVGATGAQVYPELANGRLKTFRVADSIYFPADQVLLIDADAIFMAGGAPEFVMSSEATLHEENTTPLPIGTAGTPAVVAAPVRSLYQTNSQALRMLQDLSWLMLRDGAVQQITAVDW